MQKFRICGKSTRKLQSKNSHSEAAKPSTASVGLVIYQVRKCCVAEEWRAVGNWRKSCLSLTHKHDERSGRGLAASECEFLLCTYCRLRVSYDVTDSLWDRLIICIVLQTQAAPISSTWVYRWTQALCLSTIERITLTALKPRRMTFTVNDVSSSLVIFAHQLVQSALTRSFYVTYCKTSSLRAVLIEQIIHALLFESRSYHSYAC